MQWQKTGAVRWLLSLAFGVWAVPWTGSRESVLAGGGTCGTLIPGISLHAPDLEIGFFWWGQPEAGSPTGRLSSLLTRMTHSLRGARPASKTKEPVDIKHRKEFVNYSRSRARKTHPAASKFSRPTFLHFRNFKNRRRGKWMSLTLVDYFGHENDQVT